MTQHSRNAPPHGSVDSFYPDESALQEAARKPDAVAVRPDTIPAGLKERRQWVEWKKVVRDGKATKLPFQTNGAMAKVNDPKTWNTFDAAYARYQQGGFDGVGYVFAPDDQFCGIDLDGCRDPVTGKVADWAKEIIVAADGTYAEVSPTETGVKAIVQGRWPGEKTGKKKPVKDVPKVCEKEPGIEIYSERRYFAMTGQRLAGCLEPEPRQGLIDALKRRFWPDEARRPQPPVNGNGKSHVPNADKVSARASKYVATIPGAVSGQGGHGATYHVACVLVCGFDLSEDVALPIFREWNEKCEPPWLEHELRHKLSDAAKESGERGFLLNGKNDIDGQKKDHADPVSDDGPPFDESEAMPFDDEPAVLPVDSTDPPAPRSQRHKPPSSIAGAQPNADGGGKRKFASRAPVVELYKPFPVEVLPEPVCAFVVEASKAIGCDVSFVVIPTLACLTRAIGNSRVIQLKRTWQEPAIIWAVIVGRSGTHKSPALRAATVFLTRAQARATAEHRRAMDKYPDAIAGYERDYAAWKRLRSSEPPPRKPEEPILRRYIVGDITIEALADRLAMQYDGVLVSRDELAGWADGIAEYKGGKGSEVIPVTGSHAGRPSP